VAKAFACVAAIVMLAIAAPVPVVTQGASGRAQPGGAPASRLSIVQMAEPAAVAYDGGIAGLRATRPARGRKINPNDPDVVRYVEYLSGRHSEALNAVGGGRKVYDYAFVVNGFAAEISLAQADALRRLPGVLSVSRDELEHAVTSSTPAFLGLTEPGTGLWDQLGGVSNAGEGIIIGVVDSGIWPEHPSVSDRTGTNGNGTKGGKLDYLQIPGWHGMCVPGEQFTAANCNQKLIGSRYFNAAWGGNAGLKQQRPYEFASPRDYNGHGTHTATTAGGNAGVEAAGPFSVFGPMSGIAPRARLAAYKALWHDAATGGSNGFTSDLVAAIDRAVADGVDVINYSITGTTTSFLNSVEVAFLNAAAVGVFVSAAAGNTGPTAGTVMHPSPWIATVAAGTHDRNGTGSTTLGNGATYTGASLATALSARSLVDSVNAGKSEANPTEVELCYPGTLDPAKAAGKIVLCKRGIIARVSKSLAVAQAGGVGMIMYNDTATGSLDADLHYVPSVHVTLADGGAIKAYIASAGATATASIAKATIVLDKPAPLTASFSSRGPLAAGGGDLLKPDVIAPGQDVLAGVAPPGNEGLLFSLYSGTSMATPHVAGMAALLKQLHPTWTPLMIKSALMTTGRDVIDAGISTATRIFRQGAGHVVPNNAADPGLVFDSGATDWIAFLCGTGQLAGPLCAGTGLDPSDLNVPSLAIGDLLDVQTLTRTLTNVSGRTETYSMSYTGLGGFDVAVTPSVFTIQPGASQTLTVRFDRTTAAFNSYTGGQVTWTGDRGHVVRVPVVVRPFALIAPTEVSGTGGPITYNVKFGYTGSFSATPRGLVPATTQEGTVADDPQNSFDPEGEGVTSFDLVVPAGTTYLRVALFDDFTDGNDDLDLYVLGPTGALVGASGGPTSAEQVNLVNPAAGTYKVYVHGWQTDGPDANFTLFSWLIGTAAAGNMFVSAPAAAVSGETGTVGLTFAGLAPGTRYLGSVAYGGISGLPAPTIVRIDTPQ
jgi:subtilisin family serine protease